MRGPARAFQDLARTFRRPARALLGAFAVLALLVVCACGAWPDGGPATPRDLRLMVPNTPGGGYDTTARTAARVLEETGIASAVQVFNLPGAGGTVGLQRLVDERGNGDLALQMGLGVVGASHTAGSRVTVTETTPIARLIEEAGAVVVRRDSPYRTIGALVAAWRKAPGRLKVGGGSSPGGPDHLLPMELAQAVGIDPGKVEYVAYDGGGGDLLPALLDGQVDFATSGFGEFLDQIRGGQLRVLAVTGEQPVGVLPGVPTLRASGIDLVFDNWRGIVAPPGISDADRRRWVDALTELHDSPQWRAELERHGWTDVFATGRAFASFLARQDARIAGLVRRLGPK
ncbi:Bug family tripartite tricarboxylate transporter substrate binding protein [Streptomyces lomondensis]|uniref:C4-dicarboxylate ABC transporter substrate-binding protein n=1 Tax=Streptomyces lomondensis TaxID=68229 RepID=A0ABQ2X3A2_9ACTN|nr:tripartite tricarboxylate transporter substrate binding protein [Streptomyces lomondensis]MCF0079986.1 tripartite tricarboxylate transporter substrate binding protein [Streptomyces lomondensis]GGW96962.1 C4-dicarboxylate ABC transporter substrate-binding protein [Streptomyces lomondensis]